jgi:hypothetical protein
MRARFAALRDRECLAIASSAPGLTPPGLKIARCRSLRHRGQELLAQYLIVARLLPQYAEVDEGILQHFEPIRSEETVIYQAGDPKLHALAITAGVWLKIFVVSAIVFSRFCLMKATVAKSPLRKRSDKIRIFGDRGSYARKRPG